MTKKKTHLDPRIQRTRNYIREAFIGLVLEKGYQDISIKDLADRASINRSTFYLHYQDKEDLLTSGFDEYWDQVLPGTPLFIFHKPTLMQDRLQALLESDLIHFKSLQTFYRIMLTDREVPLFRDCLSRHLLKITRQRFSILPVLTSISDIPLPILHTWFASAYLGILLRWLTESQTTSPSQLASQLTDVIVHQLQVTFRLDPISPGVWAYQEQPV